MKVYLLYLKKDRTLYAFTATKEYYECFLKQRNENCFITKRKNMDEVEFSHFAYLYKSCQLIQDIFETKNNTVTMIVTMGESSSFEQCMEDIDYQIDEIRRIFKKYPLKKKYQKAIDHLTKIDDGDGHLLIDTLSMFVDLNIDTFMT